MSNPFTPSQKSVAVRKHNIGRPLEEIAVAVKKSVEEVEAYLKTRHGYPDAIHVWRWPEKVAAPAPDIVKPAPRPAAERLKSITLVDIPSLRRPLP